jgi:hypothetical protein
MCLYYIPYAKIIPGKEGMLQQADPITKKPRINRGFFASMKNPDYWPGP